MNPRTSASILAAAVCVPCLLLPGCASVKTLPDSRQSADTVLRWPSSIHLRPFDTTAGKWEGNSKKEPKRREIRDWLMAELERNLGEIAPTRVLGGEELPASGWLVSGRFIRVNPGSKFARMFVGLGAGGSRLETKISVFDLAVSPSEALMTFTTTGGSNLAAGPQTIFNNDSEGDIERTAREAREFLRARLGARDSKEPAPESAQRMEAVEIGRSSESAAAPQERRESSVRPGGRR